MILDRTTERLRSKHVRTLELLQQTLDENAELRERLSRANPSGLPAAATSPRAASPMSPNRTMALEEEMERIKAEHCRQLVEAQDATRGQLEELTQRADSLQNQASSLEMALRSARDTLRQERFDRNSEIEALRSEIRELNHRAEASSQEVSRLWQEERQQLRQEIDAARNESQQRQVRLVEFDRQLRESGEQLETSQRELTECRTRASTLDEELTKARRTGRDLAAELAALRARESELQQTVSSLTQQRPSSAATKKLQVEKTSILAKLQEVETRNALLLNENRSLREQLAVLQSELDRSPSPPSPLRSGSVFAVHIDLKRENQQLRAQVEELKQLQRKFLTTAKKKTIAFPAL